MPAPTMREPERAADHRITVRQTATPRLAHLAEGPLAVAGREVDSGDRIGQDRGPEAEPSRVERGRLDAVVGREADDHDPLDAGRRAASPRARSASSRR